jgi:uncharacterized protein YbbC (DUF1343 family)
MNIQQQNAMRLVIKRMFQFLLAISVVCSGIGCSSKTAAPSDVEPQTETPQTIQTVYVKVGAEQLDVLAPRLQQKNIALVVNNTSLVGRTHLADTLSKLGITIKRVFAPEHGFRGKADAGEKVIDGVDSKTGLSVVSLYGSNRRPTAEQLADVDVVIFDIQDVGVRFYTYTSTLHLVMEACAEEGKQLIVLDRPNPNGSIVDGPVLEPQFKSFLGMNPLPLAHGLTVGELAKMINGEGWLGGGKKCNLEVIAIKNWKHSDSYRVNERPSPNLPNDQAIRLYPSTGLFEGTNISLGRGTQSPFQILGHPDYKNMPFHFTPVSIDGMAKNPVHEGKVCYGIDLRNVTPEKRVNLQYLIQMYNAFPDKEKFFNPRNFDMHAGTSSLREQIIAGKSEDEIRQSWQGGLEAYKTIRNKYLLYP